MTVTAGILGTGARTRLLGSMGAASATARYASTAAIVTGATVLAAGVAALIIFGGSKGGSSPTPAKTIPVPPGWPQ